LGLSVHLGLSYAYAWGTPMQRSCETYFLEVALFFWCHLFVP